MDYNDKYIKDFDEKTYLKFLSDYKLLDGLLACYKSRYEKDGKVNGNMILFQESLNNYVVKQIKTSPSFVSSNAFKNYKQYLQNAFKFHSNFFFHNIFFHAFTKDKYIQLLGNDFYNQIYQVAINKTNEAKNINYKISHGQQLTQSELNFICDVYAFNRNPDNKFHRKLIEYIFNNLTNLNSNLQCSKYVLDTILAYIPKYYSRNDGFDAINSRIVADDENVKGVGISHGQSHIFMNRNIFQNTNFKSAEDSKKTYVKHGSDFTFLMIVTNHELTHQYQNFMSEKQKFSNEGFMALKSHILNRELHDYGENHDNDDIEVDATEKGWEICGKFYQEFISDDQLKNYLCHQCMLNKRGTSNRRFDYMKKDLNSNVVTYTPFYDINNLTDILFKNPEYIKKYPILKTFYNEDGRLSPNFLKIKNICMQSVGGDYIAYLCLYFPRMVQNYLKNLNGEELNIALSNIESGFEQFIKPFNWFDYNERNGLSSEHLKFEDNQGKNFLVSHYQDALKLYSCIKFIFSDSVLMSKQSYLRDYSEIIERAMNFSTEMFNKKISLNNSDDLKI